MADRAGRIIRGLIGSPLDELARKMSTDPRIQRQIAENLPAIAQINPGLAQRIQAGDPSASVEAYQMIVKAEGQLPVRQPDPFQNIAPDSGAGMPAEFSAMTDAQHQAFVDDMARGPSPSRQMELPLGGENDAPARGLIPFGVRGPGVPVGGPTGTGVLVGETISPGVPIYPMSAFNGGLAVPQRGVELPLPTGPARIGTTAWTPVSGPPPARGVIPHPGLGGPRDLAIPRAPSAPDSRGMAMRNLAGAAAAAGAGALLASRASRDDEPLNEAPSLAEDEPAVVSGGTEDLAAETSPPPVVEATPSEPAEPAPAKVSNLPRQSPPAADLPRRPGPDTGFIETNSAYALKPAQQRTLDALLDAGIEPSRAEAIARGQRSLTQAEERAIIANGPARRQRDMDMMDQRRRARMGAY